MDIFNQLFKLLIFISGWFLVILGVSTYNNNWIITAIGGLIIFVSGVNIQILIYQKDKDPQEIIDKLKETIGNLKKT